MMEKTHWKKIVSDPNYLGEADFNEGEEKVATIKEVHQSETVVTAEGKSQKAVVHFVEPFKPMILNVARSKAIEKVAGSPYFEDWKGVRVQLYIEHNIKAFGELVSAVRVRPRKPRETPPALCSQCGNPITPANGRSAEYMAHYTFKKFGAPLCYSCAMNRISPAAGKEETNVQKPADSEAPAADE